MERYDIGDAGDGELNKTLLVGNVPYRAKADDIRHVFRGLAIVSVTVPGAMQGKSKGSAFVRFTTAEDAMKALELGGPVLMGRELHVEVLRTPAAGSRDETYVMPARRAVQLRAARAIKEKEYYVDHDP